MIMVNRKSEDGDGSSSGSNSKLRGQAPAVHHAVADHLWRRGLRSRYLAVKNLINDERDEIARHDSGNFDLIFGEMESLHKLELIDYELSAAALPMVSKLIPSVFLAHFLSQWITKPREQVADAKALLDIAKSLVMSVKGHASGGLTPSEFVSHILEEFGGQGGLSTSTKDSTRNSIAWNDIGLSVSHAFKSGPGCCTMIGPIDAEIKQRSAINRRPRKRVRPAELARPEELGGGPTEERVDTDKNMLTMFNILRKNRVVRLENLVLNRNSFAKTVENLFSLSFLIKDGRAAIKVNEAGLQLVSPRNAPGANEVRAGDVAFSHFVFRFDFNDWKLMVDSVGAGKELMPHRNSQ